MPLILLPPPLILLLLLLLLLMREAVNPACVQPVVAAPSSWNVLHGVATGEGAAVVRGVLTLLVFSLPCFFLLFFAKKWILAVSPPPPPLVALCCVVGFEHFDRFLIGRV